MAWPGYEKEYLNRLPLPLAQVYRRAGQAKEARSNHDHSFYLIELLVKYLCVAPIAHYLRDLANGEQRDKDLDAALTWLSLPSFGQWTGILRQLGKHFETKGESTPFANLRKKLREQRTDAPILDLFKRINNPNVTQFDDKQRYKLEALFDSLVTYRNLVFGHGAARDDRFYNEKMGPYLFPAVNAILDEVFFDKLSPPDWRLVYIRPGRRIASNQIQAEVYDLMGLHESGASETVLHATVSNNLQENQLAYMVVDELSPINVEPLLKYREAEHEVVILNRDRNKKQVEYLSYTTGRQTRDPEMAPAMQSFMAQITGASVDESQMRSMIDNTLAQASDQYQIEHRNELMDEPIPENRRFGDFERLSLLGIGGMGKVELARQVSLGRQVALKSLKDEFRGKHLAIQRFMREIRILGRCEHPNIVKVLASGERPSPFFAMEFVPGCNLADFRNQLSQSTNRDLSLSSLGAATFTGALQAATSSSFSKTKESIARDYASQSDEAKEYATYVLEQVDELQSLSSASIQHDSSDEQGEYVRQVARLMRDAANALQYIHDQGIVHRDIKPENFMLTPDGSRIVLMDFGLARGPREIESLHPGITTEESFLGTYRYASPEQFAEMNTKVGPAADVRALGITLWEMLARRRIFDDVQTANELENRVKKHEIPSLRDIDKSIPKDLEAIASRAAAINVEDRIQTAEEVADYLDKWLNGESIPIRPRNIIEDFASTIRRHQEIATFFFVSALIVIVSAFLITSFQRKAHLASDRAERRYRDARETVDVFFNQFAENLDDRPELEDVQQDVLRRARNKMRAFLKDRKTTQRLADLGRAQFHYAFATELIDGADASVAEYERAKNTQQHDLTIQGSRDLALTLNALGRAHQKKTIPDFQAAMDLYESALEKRKIVAESSNALHDLRWLANSYMNVGQVRSHLMHRKYAGDDSMDAVEFKTEFGLANELLQKSVDKRKEIDAFFDLQKNDVREVFKNSDGTKKMDSIRRVYRDQGKAYLNLGQLYALAVRLQAEDAIANDTIVNAEEHAISFYTKALGIYEDLLARFPKNAEYQRNYSRLCYSLGLVMKQERKTEFFARAQRVRSEQVQRFGNIGEYVLELHKAYHGLYQTHQSAIAKTMVIGRAKLLLNDSVRRKDVDQLTDQEVRVFQNEENKLDGILNTELHTSISEAVSILKDVADQQTKNGNQDWALQNLRVAEILMSTQVEWENKTESYVEVLKGVFSASHFVAEKERIVDALDKLQLQHPENEIVALACGRHHVFLASQYNDREDKRPVVKQLQKSLDVRKLPINKRTMYDDDVHDFAWSSVSLTGLLVEAKQIEEALTVVAFPVQWAQEDAKLKRYCRHYLNQIQAGATDSSLQNKADSLLAELNGSQNPND